MCSRVGLHLAGLHLEQGQGRVDPDRAGRTGRLGGPVQVRRGVGRDSRDGSLATAPGRPTSSASVRRPGPGEDRKCSARRRSSAAIAAYTSRRWAASGRPAKLRRRSWLTVHVVAIPLRHATADPLLAGDLDRAGGVQLAEVVARVRVVQVELPRDLGRGHRRPGQQRQDAQADRVGQRPQLRGRPTRIGRRPPAPTPKDMFGSLGQRCGGTVKCFFGGCGDRRRSP